MSHLSSGYDRLAKLIETSLQIVRLIASISVTGGCEYLLSVAADECHRLAVRRRLHAFVRLVTLRVPAYWTFLEGGGDTVGLSFRFSAPRLWTGDFLQSIPAIASRL